MEPVEILTSNSWIVLSFVERHAGFAVSGFASLYFNLAWLSRKSKNSNSRAVTQLSLFVDLGIPADARETYKRPALNGPCPAAGARAPVRPLRSTKGGRKLSRLAPRPWVSARIKRELWGKTSSSVKMVAKSRVFFVLNCQSISRLHSKRW